MMTKEEQTDWLCRLRAELNNGVIFTPWNKEFTEVLTSILEQESSEDCVSRQAVFDLIEHHNSDGLGSVFYDYEQGIKFADAVNKLPPVTPKGVTITDFADKCIECGREKVLDKISAEIEQLPSEVTADGRRMIRRGNVFRIIDKYRK